MVLRKKTELRLQVLMMIINKYVMLALMFLAVELALIDDKDELIEWISELGLFLFVYLVYIYFKKF
jgi:hypothetical protein